MDTPLLPTGKPYQPSPLSHRILRAPLFARKAYRGGRQPPKPLPQTLWAGLAWDVTISYLRGHSPDQAGQRMNKRGHYWVDRAKAGKCPWDWVPQVRFALTLIVVFSLLLFLRRHVSWN